MVNPLEASSLTRGEAGVEAGSSDHLLDPETLVRTCPNCSAALREERCKLLCTRCHYYMSCSDYY